MDEERRIYGLGGNVEEDAGRVRGDEPTQPQKQDLSRQTGDAARDDTVGNLDKWLRTTIETQPYTMAIVALGVGWLLGRMRRPF